MSPAVALLPSYVFPMTVTGKVRKVEMRQKSAEILDLGEAAAIRNA
jgi:fatty-acyl-CoA synthase